MTTPPSVIRTTDVELAVLREPWPFAAEHHAAIARYWQQRKAANPAFFDGEVLVLRRFEDASGRVRAAFSLERFSAFLYWRDSGVTAGDGSLDGFASALVRSADGHVVLGRTAPGTLNAGRYYLPGGFFDARDADIAGRIDLDAGIRRELQEETGLDPATLEPVPGIIVAGLGRARCFAREFRSPLAAADLVADMRASLARAGDHELTGLVAVGSVDELDRLDVLDHARHIVAAVLAGRI